MVNFRTFCFLVVLKLLFDFILYLTQNPRVIQTSATCERNRKSVLNDLIRMAALVQYRMIVIIVIIAILFAFVYLTIKTQT